MLNSYHLLMLSPLAAILIANNFTDMPKEPNQTQPSANIVFVADEENTAENEMQTNNFQNEDMEERLCLYMTIWGEGRGESMLGKELIANVILNRVASDRYPDTICGVVKQKWQFSMWNENDVNAEKVREAFKTEIGSKSVGDSILAGLKVIVGGNKILDDNVLHYHATHVNPKWAMSRYKYETVGQHTFYAALP